MRSLNLLRLPDDVFLEILGFLRPTDVLSARQVCHTLSGISRERHLWIKLSRRARHTLPLVVDTEKLTGIELEKALVGADILENKWGDEERLWIAPPFQRTSLRTHGRGQGYPVAIMGDYVVYIIRDLGRNWVDFQWVSVNNLDGPVEFNYEVPATWHTHLIEPDSSTFLLIFATSSPQSYFDRHLVAPNIFRVICIEADGVFGPHVAFDYSLLRKSTARLASLTVTGRTVCFSHQQDHRDLGRPLEFELLDLDKRKTEVFSTVGPLAVFPPEIQDAAQVIQSWASDTWLLVVYGVVKPFFAVFQRPQVASSDETKNQPSTAPAEPILKGQFPPGIYVPDHFNIFPQTPTCFAVVVAIDPVVDQRENTQPFIRVHLFFMDLAGQQALFIDASSLAIPATRVVSLVLHHVPASTRCVLGALSVCREHLDLAANEYSREIQCYTLRFNFSKSNKEDRISATPTFLVPALDHRDDLGRFVHFDPRSGRLLLSVDRYSDFSVLILKYLPEHFC